MSYVSCIDARLFVNIIHVACIVVIVKYIHVIVKCIDARVAVNMSYVSCINARTSVNIIHVSYIDALVKYIDAHA